ncbi:hypothetical protein AAFC00_000729 [Neodothiora populina]|uniref:Calcineurin-like phosphoesterase domain-containing protein n=1 Tax=Neodothiora populina TaxID=2781224 RepID=A0ABR3PE29_9PEZI
MSSCEAVHRVAVAAEDEQRAYPTSTSVPDTSACSSVATGPDEVEIQIISDLHLEFGHQYADYIIVPTAPYLVLAGDVGSLAEYEHLLSFLRRHIMSYKRIFYVLGNHEFHGTSSDAGIVSARILESEACLNGRVTILHRDRVDLEDADITLLGCTLWSHIPPSARHAVENKVKDYRHIDGWSVDVHNAQHVQDVEWLKSQLHKIHIEDPSRKVMVVTHHAPSNQGTSHPAHTQNSWTSAFSTALLEGEGATWSGISNVRYWIFGHTHWTTEFDIVGLTVLSNQRGYRMSGSIDSSSNGDGHVIASQKHTFDQSKTLRL